MAGSLPWPAEPLTPRAGHAIVWIALALVLALLGAGAWAAVRPSAAAPSAHGCVNIVIASSTGGSYVHECGSAARTLCAAQYSLDDTFARLTQTQCRLAGIDS